MVLRSGRILLPRGFAPGRVAIRDGRIAEVLPDGPADQDLGNDWLIPALTDTHVHLNEPGRTEWEGFHTGTRAAAAGGVTLVVDMPLNSIPVTTSLDAAEAKRQAARGSIHVDLGLWGGVIPGNSAELAPMAESGVLGFKCFLCPSGIDEFPAATEADLLVAMPILRQVGVPLLVHAELESELRATDADPRAYTTYLHSRPKEWEERAVALVVDLVRRTGARAHVVHLSSGGALERVRRAKADGLPITAETCPHYLGLAAEDVPYAATEYKCAPPIRERANADLLWAALLDGTLDFVVTDHSPCVPSLKQGDFLQAWGGIASLQLGLRSVLTEGHRRGLDPATVIGWLTREPARWLGRSDRGRIEVGTAADLVRVRPEVERALEPSELLHRHPTTPWAGRRLRGEIVTTWLRGEPVWDAGRIVGPPRGGVVR